eukprot:1114969-Rhodomonas_salina.4
MYRLDIILKAVILAVVCLSACGEDDEARSGRDCRDVGACRIFIRIFGSGQHFPCITFCAPRSLMASSQVVRSDFKAVRNDGWRTTGPGDVSDLSTPVICDGRYQPGFWWCQGAKYRAKTLQLWRRVLPDGTSLHRKGCMEQGREGDTEQARREGVEKAREKAFIPVR